MSCQAAKVHVAILFIIIKQAGCDQFSTQLTSIASQGTLLLLTFRFSSALLAVFCLNAAVNEKKKGKINVFIQLALWLKLNFIWMKTKIAKQKVVLLSFQLKRLKEYYNAGPNCIWWIYSIYLNF